ncbi:MAG: hypothetical protein WAK93_13495 [Solirubrobacteraceae bacterium]
MITVGSPRRLQVLVATLAGVVAIAGCGANSSSPSVSGGTTATGDASPIGLSKCMRAHGVPNFPDPTAGPGGEGFNGISTPIGGHTLTVDGITFSGPALQTAEKACQAYLPGGGGPPPPISPAQKAKALAFARCIREHGVPGFPDPVFPGHGGVKIRSGVGVNPNSPAFAQAANACGGAGRSIVP